MRVAFIVVVAVFVLAVIAMGYFLGTQGTFQPGVDVSGRTVTAVPLHIDALQNPAAAVRKKAATALWLIGPEASQACASSGPCVDVASPKWRTLAM